jgi:hypothetical protein
MYPAYNMLDPRADLAEGRRNKKADTFQCPRARLRSRGAVLSPPTNPATFFEDGRPAEATAPASGAQLASQEINLLTSSYCVRSGQFGS